MNLLGLDVGSSSVKAAVLRDGKIRGKVVRAKFETHYDDQRAEVEADKVLGAISDAIRQVGPAAKKVDAIALSVMAPSWVAMDRSGKPLTPVVTHQDRRSVEIARELEQRVGKARCLKLAGNRPFPGGISSTTFAWFAKHARGVMRKADLVGHLSTLIHRRLSGARVTDPSNASFMGVYLTCTLQGWSDELCEAVGLSRKLLPDVHDANVIAGRVHDDAARQFGVTPGTPVMTGMMDTGAAMLLTGAKPGQLVNVSGSTDVLILCSAAAHPHEKLLTRALGLGRRWTSVSTIAAAGSTLNWLHSRLCSELSDKEFFALLDKLTLEVQPSSVVFEPYLAGERVSVEQRRAAFSGLTLSTTREQMLSAAVEALASASAARLQFLRETGQRIGRNVMLSGGVQSGKADLMHRDWPGTWKFKFEDEATLRGLAKLEPVEG